jgi:NAD(P)-dependent dehydrogenase (short-subunit alcohol dehydrogenase family)
LETKTFQTKWSCKKLETKKTRITGSNSGIGVETARTFYKAGAHVVIAARDTNKSEKIKKEITNEKGGQITVLPLDLGDFSSIDAFVDSFQKLNLPLHILINNAGVMMTPKKKTKDGFEFQGGVNHLGHARLTFKLIPIMSQSEGQKRIVILSSRGHLRGKKNINFEDYHFENRKYDPLDSYAQSKLSSLLFSKELNRKLNRDFGSENFICCSVHPGVIQTELQQELSEFQKMMIMTTMKVTQGVKTTQQGAATTVYGAVSDEVKGGEYLADCGIAKEILKYAEDEKMQKKLFELTEKEIKCFYKDVVQEKEDKSESKNSEEIQIVEEVIEEEIVEKPTLESRLDAGQNIWIHAESVDKENHEEFYRAIGFPEAYLKGFIQKDVIFETRGDKEGYDFTLISPLHYEVSGKWGETVTLEPLKMKMSVEFDVKNSKSKITFTMENGKSYFIDRTISDEKGMYFDEFHFGNIVAKTTYKRVHLERMRGIFISEYGDLNVLQYSQKLPVPKIENEEEVLIEIHAASLNPYDYKLRNGVVKLLYQYKFPLILGHDASGVVTKVGSKVTKFKKGDEVFVRVPGKKIGTFSEFIAVEEQFVALKPKNLSHIEASSIPLVCMTAYQGLNIGKINPNDKVFITGGAV